MFYSKSENRRKRWWRVLTIGQKKLLWLAFTLLVLILLIVGVLFTYSYRAAKYEIESVVSGDPVTVLYDYDNHYITSLYGVRHRPVVWAELPQDLINAFVAREDENFFEHDGIVYSAVLRSVFRNVSSMSYEQGASTITMQLARNVFELQDKTLDRKILEAFIAQRIEDKYDKRTILVQYLNRIYFGQNCYGVGAAAEYYFGKKVSELNLAECATLAGIVRGPSLCNPVTSMENAMGVKRETLERMYELSLITEEQKMQAQEAAIELHRGENKAEKKLSYVTTWGLRELDTLRHSFDRDAVGLAIVSTFDLELQQYVETASERALVMVEGSSLIYPEAWVDATKSPEGQKQDVAYFTTAKRPRDFKVRGDGNDFEDIVQCCVLVVDCRARHFGEVMAVTSGRSVADGKERWQRPVQPGRALAPLLFAAAGNCNDGQSYIITSDVRMTGEKTGFENVKAYFEKLQLGADFSAVQKESDLYEGKISMQPLGLVRALISLQNNGREVDLHCIDTVWSRARHKLYVYKQEETEEFIPRETAGTVASLSPFIHRKDTPILLSEGLVDNGGFLTMACNARGVAVFVWIGFDDPSIPAASNPVVRRLMSRASVHLAKELHKEARRRLIERPAGK